MSQRDIEIVNVLNGSSCTVGGRSIFSKEFPLGEAWHRINLRFNIAVTIGTGSGAIAEGELHFIKNILMRTDKGEVLCNLPGRALYKIAQYKAGSAPRKDAMAAASATYRVNVPIFFVDDTMGIPTDTILDTARYNAITLDVTLGTVADLFTTVGTSSVTCTIDAEVEKQKGLLPPNVLPIYHVAYEFSPPQDANSGTTIDIDRSTDLAIKRLYVHACSSGSAGVPYSGANADDVQNLESVQDQNGFIIQERVHEMIQDRNQIDAALESVMTGVTVFDFVRDGSNNSALYTGDKSKLQYKWTNKAGVAANDIVTVAYEGLRTLK